jgi:hypothetical protein
MVMVMVVTIAEYTIIACLYTVVGLIVSEITEGSLHHEKLTGGELAVCILLWPYIVYKAAVTVLPRSLISLKEKFEK